ncbi:cytochrome c peroxidase [Microvirga massiliensis]|uniref:cytochrome c peroxidase n=1 Tax=Microvirga massiliensis TaxID=1033741 RepID=UPI00069A83FC|nr:cytochrome c peroxidase [Microvirga massiliensis]
MMTDPRRRLSSKPWCARIAAAAVAASAAGLGLARADPGENTAAPTPGSVFDAAHWRNVFARPREIPAPQDNPTTPEKVALGRQLFDDVRLSGSNGVACSSCHQPELSFSDGVPRRIGLAGEPLARRTPPLWNLAWGLTFFWDGRATSLEDQVRFPVENRHEMGGNITETATELARDAGMRAKFATAFRDDPAVTPANIAKAVAAYERTLVSPGTRFDRWVEGDDTALSSDERAGLMLFVGKAGCAACHTGWRFTDEAFHDIGLATAGPDRGRGSVLDLPAADHAFKTPSLRERVWTAPYLHDGSLNSLEDVVAHYVGRVQRRPTLSGDLKPALNLTENERDQLVAFLASLSSEDPPRPLGLPSRVQMAGSAMDRPPVSAGTVGQRDRRFTPGAVALKKGEALTIVNDDTRTHNVRIDDPRLSFSSDAQAPGGRVVVTFPETGQFRLICGIHPEMRLDAVVSE